MTGHIGDITARSARTDENTRDRNPRSDCMRFMSAQVSYGPAQDPAYRPSASPPCVCPLRVRHSRLLTIWNVASWQASAEGRSSNTPIGVHYQPNQLTAFARSLD